MRSIDVIKKVNALKARQQLGQLLEEVYYRGDQYIIERAGKPMAAVVPVWFVDAWQQRRDAFFAMIDAVHACNADVPPEVIEREVAEAVQHVRHEAVHRQP
jgi:prevent-host-death family protein